MDDLQFKETRSSSIRVVMNQAEKAQLDELATYYSASKSSVIRALIDMGHRKLIQAPAEAKQ